jgi:hypothetical protein
MDAAEIWTGFLASFQAGWPRAVQLAYDVLANPIARAIGLMLLVYVTIRVIAAVYAGEQNRAELGPVAIRQHQSARLDSKTVRIPHQLIPMSMDGVSADCRIYYAYTDARGKRRRRLVHTIRDARLSVSPVRLNKVQDVIYGQEVPSVPREHVCFPVDIDTPLETVPATPDDARAYADLHRLLERWREDDDAIWISLSADMKDAVAAGKVEFINDKVAALKRAKATFLSRRLRFRRLYAERPNVIGSYYLKFEFSHEPLFVLTRHPDRDLKMTAWLTILTSMFALVMDWWPNGQAPFAIAAPSEISAPGEGRAARAPRAIVP